MQKVWVYTKDGEEKWKTSRLPEFVDDTHDEGKLVPESDYRYCETWALDGWVKQIEVSG